jgi:hypothetical protein
MLRDVKTVTSFMLISADFTIRTMLVSTLFRQFDSFFGTCRKIYNSFPLADMNQGPEKDILVRNQKQMYNKKYPVNTM